MEVRFIYLDLTFDVLVGVSYVVLFVERIFKGDLGVRILVVENEVVMLNDSASVLLGVLGNGLFFGGVV